MSKTAVALRHVQFEDLGSFETLLRDHGYHVIYCDLDDPSFCGSQAEETDLLVVLGGPVGVYDMAYPFLSKERDLLRARLATGLPTLGICLGAQLMASALNANVFPSGLKEIGFFPLKLTAEGRSSPLRHFDGVHVLHWHGDTYHLPAEASNLASTSKTAQQAFAVGRNILGIQFHPEVQTGRNFERWLVGHAVEIAAARLDPAALRADGEKFGPKLSRAAADMLTEWLQSMEATR